MMQIHHGRSEAVIAAEPTAVRDSGADSLRLEQLEQAREADRVWRAGRKAELERLIRRGALQHCLAMIVVTVVVFAAIQASRPWVAHDPESATTRLWELLSGLAPPFLICLSQFLFGRCLRPLKEELWTYERKPEEPVVWSTGLTIGPATQPERAECHRLKR